MDSEDFPPEHPLHQWIASKKAMLERMHKQFGKLDKTQLNSKPSPQVWSIGQCLDHLIIIGRKYIPAMARTIEKAERQQLFATAMPEHGWVGRRMLKSVHPDNKKKTKTFRFLKPREGTISTDIIRRFSDMMEEQVALMEKVRDRGVDLNHTKLRMPTLPVLNVRLGECFEYLTAHEERHMKQAERMLQNLNRQEAA